MTPNQRTVDAYMEAFRRTDHAAVLACLTDDVEWILPGAFHKRGKAEFDSEIENAMFVGSPRITVTRVVEQDDVVVAEGEVRAAKRAGGELHAVFCDVFVMRGARIRQLTSYVMELRDGASATGRDQGLGPRAEPTR